MNKPFLYRVMEDLYQRYEGNLQNVTIVFPNKRAGLFANQYLSEIANKPVWAPRYTAISEFFTSLTDKKVPEKIDLLIYLFNAYQKSRKDEKQPFDTFYNWGEILLADFQDIDNNMVDAGSLFDNVSALKAVDRLDYLQSDQIEAIKSYFTDFDPQDKNRMHQRFVDMWNSMMEIYEQFRQDLAADGLAYDAMLKREIIERLDTLDEEVFTKKYAFVGFNVLNETERRLFKYLQTNAETLFYWDYDPTFIKHEAASFIEENMKMFPNALKTTLNNQHQIDVNLVSASTDQAQASYVNYWLKDVLKENQQLNQTAVILADENILSGVIHALPDTQVNITMGYPLQQTAIASLITALIELQMRGQAKGNSWYHTYVTAILRHPYILQSFPSQAKTVYAELHKHNEMYPSIKYLTSVEPSDKDFSNIFTPQTADTLLPYLADIVRRIGIANKHADPLTVEAIFTAYSVIVGLQNSLSKTSIRLNTQTSDTDETQGNNSVFSFHFISSILSQQIAGQSIAFHGEPANGIQVMGMLETRNLNFKNIVILSANEGMLPKVSHAASFIPYFLRDANNMTTIEKQTSLYAYYFYRLFKHADRVSLVYNNNTEGLKKGEASRFLLQLKLEQELPLTLTEQSITSENEIFIHNIDEIVKTDNVMKKMVDSLTHKHNLQGDSESEPQLSPSAINTYLSCKMKFFLQHVAKLRAQDEISEEIEANTFGSIIHEVMHKIYEPYICKQLTESAIKRLADDKHHIEDLIDHAFSQIVFNQKHYMPPKYNGEQMLNKYVIMQYVIRQIKYDATMAPLTILALETDVATTINFSDSNYIDHIKLFGRIDRIDKVTIDGRTITRIVDYKTSNTIQKIGNFDLLFDPEKTSDHILQTFCYADMLLSEHSQFTDNQSTFISIAPSLNYLKKLYDKEHKPVITIGNDQITDFANHIQTEFHKRLEELIQEIFSTDIPFSKAETEKPCTYCDFKQICNRQGEKY